MKFVLLTKFLYPEENDEVRTTVEFVPELWSKTSLLQLTWDSKWRELFERNGIRHLNRLEEKETPVYEAALEDSPEW